MKRFVFALVLFITACASAPPKQVAAQSLQVSETALAAAQDIERSLCFVNPATEKGNHCTSPVAATVHLTDALHVKFAENFEKAFDIQFKAAVQVQTWTPGQAPPASFSTYNAAVQQVLDLALTIAPANSKAIDLIAKAKAASDAAGSVATALGVK